MKMTIMEIQIFYHQMAIIPRIAKNVLFHITSRDHSLKEFGIIKQNIIHLYVLKSLLNENIVR